MKSFHIPRTALFFILFALAAFAVLYRPIDLKALVRASSQGTLRTEEVAHFGSTNDMDYHLLSMDSEAFQQTAELLSTVSCRKKLNQNYSATPTIPFRCSRSPSAFMTMPKIRSFC